MSRGERRKRIDKHAIRMIAQLDQLIANATEICHENTLFVKKLMDAVDEVRNEEADGKNDLSAEHTLVYFFAQIGYRCVLKSMWEGINAYDEEAGP